MERKVGESFATTKNGTCVDILVVENKPNRANCAKCIFNTLFNCDKNIREVGFCTAINRKDQKNVHFEKYLNSNMDTKTFEDACKVIGVCSDLESMFKEHHTFKKSRASIASVKLNIIRQALNRDQKMELTKGIIYYPCVIFTTKGNTYYNAEIQNGNMIEVAQFISDSKIYTLLGGCTDYSMEEGLGDFNSANGVAYSTSDVGFLGCATEEIAQHMSKYFAKEIFEAKYGDFINFEWIE